MRAEQLFFFFCTFLLQVILACIYTVAVNFASEDTLAALPAEMAERSACPCVTVFSFASHAGNADDVRPNFLSKFSAKNAASMSSV